MDVDRWIIGFALPVVILLFSVLGKKMARTKWRGEDLYFADQLLLAAAIEAGTSIISAFKSVDKPLQNHQDGNFLMLLLSLLLFFSAQSFYQDYGPNEDGELENPKAFRWFAMIADIVGTLGLVGASLLLV